MITDLMNMYHSNSLQKLFNYTILKRFLFLHNDYIILTDDKFVVSLFNKPVNKKNVIGNNVIPNMNFSFKRNLQKLFNSYVFQFLEIYPVFMGNTLELSYLFLYVVVMTFF